MPTRNYTAEIYHRSIGLCRFHDTPCARSSHARADMHAAAGEVDAKLEETSTVPCQRVITQPKIITDHFAFADSMPHHARARPMRARTCTPPLCSRHRHHRHLHWQCATTLQLEARRIDQFTLAKSLPCHVRARPMCALTCTPPPLDV